MPSVGRVQAAHFEGRFEFINHQSGRSTLGRIGMTSVCVIRNVVLSGRLHLAESCILFGPNRTDRLPETFGVAPFDWLASHLAEASLFNDTMVGFHGIEPPAIASAYDFSPFRTIAGVGGMKYG